LFTGRKCLKLNARKELHAALFSGELKSLTANQIEEGFKNNAHALKLS